MLTDEQLKTWRRLTDAATPLPWRRAGWEVLANGGTAEGHLDLVVGIATNDVDAQFFAAAREAMPLLLAEVERLRTPSGAVGRVGFEAFRRQRDADGLGGGGPTWEDYERDAPRWPRAWRAAGQAERAVAYTLAVDCVTAGDVGDIQRRILRLAQPPATAKERMARIKVLLHEVGALAGEVLADGEADGLTRATAEAIRTGLPTAISERTPVATMGAWTKGPPGPEVPPASECLRGALVSTRTALDLVKLAARRASSLPMGRALVALEQADAQLDAAVRLEPVKLMEWVPEGFVYTGPVHTVENLRLEFRPPTPAECEPQPPPAPRQRQPEPTPESSPLANGEASLQVSASSAGTVACGCPVLLVAGGWHLPVCPEPMNTPRPPTALGLRELTQASEECGDYFGADPDKTPTGPVEPLKDGEG